MNCTCAGSGLNHFTMTKCGDNFGAPHVMALLDMNALPEVTGNVEDSLVDKAWWAANVGNKVSISPVVWGWSATPGEEVRWGEDEDPDHIGQHVRVSPTTAEATFRSIPASLEKELQQILCVAQSGRLGVYFFTADGRIVGKSSGENNFAPIPCQKFFVGDRAPMAGDEPDSNTLNIAFAAGWSNNLKALDLTKNGTATENWRGVDLLALS